MDNNEFLQKLSKNLLGLLDDGKYCDVTIEVGDDPDTKEFQAHIAILSYRSTHFRKLLMTDKKNDEILTYIRISNILPETFQIILRYIYSGKLSLGEYEVPELVKILVAASGFELQELVDFLQSFLIKNKANWMEQNFDFMCQISYESDTFLELQKYCIEFLSNKPDMMIKSLNSYSIPKKLMIAILQNNNLNMDEIQLWDYIVKWGLSQNPTLSPNLTNYSKDDFDVLKNTLQDCIPFIKFHNLTSKEFLDKVLPYRKVLPKELYMDLLKEFLENDYRPILKPIPGENANIDSNILDSKDSTKTNPKILNTIDSRTSKTFDSKDLTDPKILNTIDSRTSKTFESRVSSDSKILYTVDSGTSTDSRISNIRTSIDSKISNAIYSKFSKTFDSRNSSTLGSKTSSILISKKLRSKSVDSTMTSSRKVTIIDPKMTNSIIVDKPNDLNVLDTKFFNPNFIDSKIISSIHTELISKWIDKSNTEEQEKLTSPYEFRLLFRGSREWFSTKKFHKICENKAHTVAVVQVEGSDEIFGGYNPITWRSDRTDGVTKDSFIFSFKNNTSVSDYILSRVVNEKNAINNGMNYGPSFGNEDLHIYRSYLRGELSVYCSDHKKSSYERPIKEDPGYVGRARELEVFQVILPN